MKNKIYEHIAQKVTDWVKQDEENIVNFFSKLVQCKTPSNVGDTREAMTLVKEFMQKNGLPYNELYATPIMPNLISSFDTKKNGRHIMFNGHLDVMPAGNETGWQYDEWSGKIADGKVWGRGSSDMKAGVTAMLFAYSYLYRLKDELAGKLSLTLVSDEETGYDRGTGFLFEKMENEMLADCVLSAEPSGTEAINFSSKGYMEFTVFVQTRGAIAGYPNESDSAIRIAADIIRDLDELKNLKFTVPDYLTPYLTSGTFHKEHERLRGNGHARLLDTVTADICTVQGGDLLSVIAPNCTFTVTLTTPVGADVYGVYTKVRDVIAQYPQATLFFDGASVADISSPYGEMVGILQDTVQELGWEKPTPQPDVAISDCRHWRYRGIPAYWYGASGDNCSAANENVSIKELLHIVRTHALSAAKYLLSDNSTKENLQIPVAFSDTEPQIMKIPPMKVACKNGYAESYQAKHINPVINKMIDELYSDLMQDGVEMSSAANVIFQSAKQGVSVKVAVPVKGKLTSNEKYSVEELPTIEQAAVYVHRGATDTAKSWSALNKWISENGYSSESIYREQYVICAPNPAEYHATELIKPIKKRRSKRN